MIATPIAMDVPLRTDKDGEIRVGNTRVTLMTIVGCHQRGDTPQEIHDGFPTVALADIYAVIAYYLANRDEVDAYIHQIETDADELRTEMEANNPKAAAFNAKVRAALEQKQKREKS